MLPNESLAVASAPGKSRNIFFAIAAVLVLAIAGFLFYRATVYKTGISEFQLTASVADAAGISPESRFVLKTTTPLSAAVLEKYLKIVPEVDFNIEAVAGAENTFEFIPETALVADQVYTIKVEKGPLASRDFSWAYQVKAPFQVISSLPVDKGVSVPAETGIELTFNRENILDSEQFIEISPAAKGRFESKGETVIFIPDRPLELATIYSVTIKKGLRAGNVSDVLESETVIRFQTAEERYNSNKPYLSLSNAFKEFAPQTPIIFSVTAYNISSVAATVYRFDSTEELIAAATEAGTDVPWAYSYSANVKLPANKKVLSADISIEDVEEYEKIIRLPQQLPAGYYALSIFAGNKTSVVWFQVSPTASFTALAAKQSLIWLKDVVSEKNLGGVPILYDGKTIAQTNAEGVAVFDTPAELVRKPTDSYSSFGDGHFFVAQTAGASVIIPAQDQYGSDARLTEEDKWWKYISLNKTVYLPTDTLYFWGIQRPREGSIAGEELSVALSEAFWEGDAKRAAEAEVYARTSAEVSGYHTVTGELSFADLSPGTYDLTFRKGDEIVGKKTVTVSAYRVPAYKVTVTPDTYAVFHGDSVTFRVKAELFDGTPFSGPFSYTGYLGYSEGSYQGDFILNALGEATFTIATTLPIRGRGYWPTYLSVNVKPKTAEEADISASTSVFVFGPRLTSLIEGKQDTDSVDFTIETKLVSFSSQARVEPYWERSDYSAGPVGGASTKITVSTVSYNKEQTDTGYDPVNKVTYPVYRYWTSTHPLTTQVVTADNNGVAHFSYPLETDKTYKFDFFTPDGLGKADEQTRYVYGGQADVDSKYQFINYTLEGPEYGESFKVGQEIDLRLQSAEGVTPSAGAKRFIFLTVNNGALEYRIEDAPHFKATFRAQDIPNIGIWPGWFADGRFQNAHVRNLSFDANERRLSVETTADKQSYQPGDSVTLDVRVTDPAGKPVRAAVNLSALDEAVFAVRPEESDIANLLYADLYSQLIIRTSHTPPYDGGGAEKGGGEGDGIRSDLREMALFKEVVTDSGGRARVEFKLPENITSWRITTQAVTPDLFAGKTVEFIPVTLPFFIDTTLNRTYLSGDKLDLRARAFGAAAAGTVRFIAESPTLGFQKVERLGIGSAELPLGELTTGVHDLTVQGQASGQTDGVRRSLTVVDSYFTKLESDFYEATPGLTIANKAQGGTELTFSSLGRGKLLSELKGLLWERGVRIDQKGAEVVAGELLNTYFGGQYELPDLFGSRYQDYLGGLRLLPYSDEELELSALGAHLLPNSAIKKGDLKDYLRRSLTDEKADTGRIIRALYGLTAFNEPVLTKIQMLKDDWGLTTQDKIFIALSLDALGAKEEARAFYQEEIKPHINIGRSSAQLRNLSGDELVLATDLAAALAASLEEPEANLLAAFAAANPPRSTLDNFERLLYIKLALPRLSAQEASFSYRVGTEEKSKTLAGGEVFALSLSAQELKTFALTDVSGKVGVVASYEATASPASIVKDPGLTLNRFYVEAENGQVRPPFQIHAGGNGQTTFNEGDLVVVLLDYRVGGDMPQGPYQIVDYLPSGLRAVDTETSYGYDYKYYGDYEYRIAPTEIEDQKVTFVVGAQPYYNRPVYYLARVVSKGVYKAEPALLQSLSSLERTTITNAATITIK